MENVWKDEGGLQGFNKHLQEVAKNWPHITLSPDLWTKVAPESCVSAHLYLKAIQLLADAGEMDNTASEKLNGRTCFEEAIWLFRDVFFEKVKILHVVLSRTKSQKNCSCRYNR